MATRKLLEPFYRKLNDDQEPNDHQRMFLYLPLPILRDFTNIESLIIDDFVMKKAKQPTQAEIEKTIDKYHQQMGQLKKWKNWELHKLEFRLAPSNNTG